MQTILGSGGAIGNELAKALTAFTDEIRLVSRHPEKVNTTDRLLKANLLEEDEVREAVNGSSVVYLTVGLPYNTNIWRESWPKIISNIINACKEYESRLVFFDNIYMYDPNYLDGMNEETPVNPSSQKGKIRARLAAMIMDEVKAGRLTALIARSADFYGPGIQNTSVLTETVLNPLSRGKKANWLGSDDVKHSYTYTPDAGWATALLGNTEDAYNQVWHLPTAPDPLTGKEWVETFADKLGVRPGYRKVPKFLVRILGLFDPVMKELVEMMYQYDRNYVFDSSKFERRFDFKPTSYAEGMEEIVKRDYQSTGTAAK